MTLVIQQLRDEWKKSDFQLTAEQLTELVPPILTVHKFLTDN